MQQHASAALLLLVQTSQVLHCDAYCGVAAIDRAPEQFEASADDISDDTDATVERWLQRQLTDVMVEVPAGITGEAAALEATASHPFPLPPTVSAESNLHDRPQDAGGFRRMVSENLSRRFTRMASMA